MDNNEKIALLREECDKYLLHLERSINRLSADLLPEARARILKQGSEAIDVNKLIETKKMGRSLYYPADNGIDTSVHSKVWHPKLYVALDKYQAISEMKECLTKTTDPSDTRLNAFNDKFNKSQEILSRNLDNSAMKFIKNILHVLTAGLYSKLTKDTFQFWKTQGEIFTENVNDTMKIK